MSRRIVPFLALLASVSTAQAASFSDPTSVAGDHKLLSGDANCPDIIRLWDAADEEYLSIHIDGPVVDSGVVDVSFYQINSGGYYSFDSSSSQWTFQNSTLKVTAARETIVKKVAKATFVRPLRFLAREESRLTLEGSRLTLRTPVYSSAVNGAKTIACEFQLAE